MTMTAFSNVLGLMGVAMIVYAYWLTQTGTCRPDAYYYLYLNLCGALLITISLLYHWNLASFIIEMFWIAISVYGLVKRYRRPYAGPSVSDN